MNSKVSVLLITYNHEEYIEEAIKSILIQQCDFSYEIVVADDCSTDSTMSVVQKYKALYPDRFVILESTCNLGITKNYQRGFAACQTEYIAVIEGDDYWTTPHKLTMHINFLDNHKECVMSFNRFVVRNIEEKRYNIQPWPVKEEYQLVTVTDLVIDNFIGNFSTCVYRNNVIKMINPDLYNLTVYDWMFNIVVAQSGLIGYLSEVMSVYRLHANGTWTQNSESKKIKQTMEKIDEYDNYLQFRYKAEFGQHKRRLESRLAEIENPNGTLRKKYILKQYVPPIIIKVLKMIVPPKLIELIKK